MSLDRRRGKSLESTPLLKRRNGSCRASVRISKDPESVIGLLKRVPLGVVESIDERRKAAVEDISKMAVIHARTDIKDPVDIGMR